MGIKKYKYLVVSGCSQTYGQACDYEKTWPYRLAKRLGLELINLALPGQGWYFVENHITSFIHHNKDILHECFFILQKSMLERRLDYLETPITPTDIWEQYNMNFVSKTAASALGYKDWEKYTNHPKPEWFFPYNQSNGIWIDEHDVNSFLIFFPEHRHYPDSRHGWKHDGKIPPYMEGQFDELMLYWGRKMYSFHLFLKSLDIDHIMVDGYSPFLSHKLDFKNYYESDEEFEYIKLFWSTDIIEDDEQDVMLYDFKNLKSTWLFDKIDIKNKIDDVVLWSLYQYHSDTSWNIDGGHAGPLGMKKIEKVIYDNLVQKGWFDEIHN